MDGGRPDEQTGAHSRTMRAANADPCWDRVRWPSDATGSEVTVAIARPSVVVCVLVAAVALGNTVDDGRRAATGGTVVGGGAGTGGRRGRRGRRGGHGSRRGSWGGTVMVGGVTR